MKNIAYVALFTAAIALTSGQAFAQAVPGSADVSRVPKRLEKPTDFNDIDVSVQVEEGQERSAPAGAEKVKLKLKAIELSGATVYSDKELMRVYGDKVGTQITLADVYGIASQLTAKYRNEGFILTQVIVPPQTIETGLVKLQVVEGFIDKISVEGQTRNNKDKIRKIAKALTKNPPLNSKTLEHVLLILNDMPGVEARSVLSPSLTTPGASDVAIVVSDGKKYEGFAQLDNRGSRYLGPLQMNYEGQTNSLLGFNENIALQYVTAPDGQPDREMDFVSLSYMQPVGNFGTTLEGAVSMAWTDPGFELSQFDIKGKSESFLLRAVHPFIRTRNKNLNFSVQFDALNSDRSDNVTVGDTEDRVRSLRLGGLYQFSDRFVGVNTIGGEISQGLDILGERGSGSTNLTKARGRSDYTKVNASISRVQYLTDGVELQASVKGQKSAHNLLSSEEFGIGGAEYGRAYDNSEIVGEDGVAGSLEIRWDNPKEIKYVNAYQLFGFYDIGRVWDRDNTVAQNRIQSIASLGAGVRVSVTDIIDTSLEFAMPLTRNVETRNDKDTRVFMTLSASY